MTYQVTVSAYNLFKECLFTMAFNNSNKESEGNHSHTSDSQMLRHLLIICHTRPSTDNSQSANTQQNQQTNQQKITEINNLKKVIENLHNQK